MPDIAMGDHQFVHSEVQYETKDVNVSAVLWFGVGLAAFVVLSALVVVPVFHWFGVLERQQKNRPLPPLAAKERLAFPKNLDRVPGPLLQESEKFDMERLRAQEDALLKTKEGGIVPIEEAIERMSDPKFAAEHGIRVRPAAEIARVRKLDEPRPAVKAVKGARP